MGEGDLGFVMLDKPSNEKEISLICVLSLHRHSAMALTAIYQMPDMSVAALFHSVFCQP